MVIWLVISLDSEHKKKVTGKKQKIHFQLKLNKNTFFKKMNLPLRPL
jgi:hypothetical protein